MRSIVLLLASLSLSASFRLPQQVERKVAVPSSECNVQQSLNRVIIASTLAVLGWCGDDNNHRLNLYPPPAYALQERNKVLCGTGFFTNVGAWYCTDIGNIGDEGSSKPLSKQEASSVDSLMSKFNFKDDSITTTAEESSSGSSEVKQTEGKKMDESK